jgi:hypothetical protein
MAFQLKPNMDLHDELQSFIRFQRAQLSQHRHDLPDGPLDEPHYTTRFGNLYVDIATELWNSGFESVRHDLTTHFGLEKFEVKDQESSGKNVALILAMKMFGLGKNEAICRGGVESNLYFGHLGRWEVLMLCFAGW